MNYPNSNNTFTSYMYESDHVRLQMAFFQTDSKMQQKQKCLWQGCIMCMFTKKRAQLHLSQFWCSPWLQFSDTMNIYGYFEVDCDSQPWNEKYPGNTGHQQFRCWQIYNQTMKIQGITRNFFYLKLVLVCGYCHCLRLSVWVPVSPSVRQSFHLFIHHFSVRDNSWPVQARINKFRPQVQKNRLRSLLFFRVADLDRQGQI